MGEPDEDSQQIPVLSVLPHEWRNLRIYRDGIYHRMQDDDRTKRFNNKMRLTLQGSVAILQKQKKQPIELTIEWHGDQIIELDWTPVSEDWGRAVFRVALEEGILGLIEGGEPSGRGRFWKFHGRAEGADSSLQPVLEDARSREREANRSVQPAIDVASRRERSRSRDGA